MKKTDYLEAFAQQLARLLQDPTDKLPGVRCVSRRTLYLLFNQLRDELRSVGMTRDITQRELLDALTRMSILRSIPVEENGRPVFGSAYYAVGFEPSEKTEVDPKELLQAALPEGVICYFTALSFHGLTTQIPSHHHIARLREDRTDKKTPQAVRTRTRSEREPSSYSRMGRVLFRYRSASYYWTTRSARVLRAMASWRLNPKLTVRVVTLEQALLDTLHKPIRCGGPSVTQEAWEEAIEEARLDQAKLARILEDTGTARLARQVGYLLSEMGVETERGLRRVIENALESTDRSDGSTAPPLMPDYSCTVYNEEWHLMLPSW